MSGFRSYQRWTLAAVLAVGLGSSVSAEILVSNLANPYRSATPIGNNPNPVEPPGGGPWYWATQSFVTDAVEYRLTSVEAYVGDGSIKPAPIVVAELHADDQGAVGALIATFTAPDVSDAQSVRAFTPDTPVTLAPLTTYWFVLGVQAPGDGTYFWGYANGHDIVGPGALALWAYSTDSGGTWVLGQDFPYFIQVNATTSVDTDGDGIHDPLDVCCNTPIGVPVDGVGRPVGDLDLDCDNDLDDLAIYSRGFTGPLADPVECP